MTNIVDYELIDFGEGRKLESFGGYRVDRPSPAAEGERKCDPRAWRSADARFDATSRGWQFARAWPERLIVDCGTFRMPVRPTPFGHVGLFPEQSPHWDWLGAPRRYAVDGQPIALNLFAYTGASTMALVSAGYRVAHVDAAKPNVSAAREAARANGWREPPIRFLVDDAAKFAAREVRRGNRYQAVVLDPPTYGHAPGGRTWRIGRDLWPLLADCLRLCDRDGFRLLITGHAAELGPDEVIPVVRQIWSHPEFTATRPPGPDNGLRITSGRSQLGDRAGRRLDAGFFVRVETG